MSAVKQALLSFAVVSSAILAAAPQASSLANSDPAYVSLRSGALKKSYRVSNVTLTRDVGTLVLKTGTVEFLPPVLNRVVIGVFSGDGEFRLKPATSIEESYLKRMTGAGQVNELFRSAVLCFTDETFDEIVKAGQSLDQAPAGNDILREFRSRMRHRSDEPRSMLEALLGGEDVVNIEAELLADLYDARAPKSFSAYLHGKKYADLRFLVKPHGAMPALPSPEEVALLNVDAQADKEGIWYLSHYASEWKANTAASTEDKRAISVEHYKVETTVEKNDQLTATCNMRVKAMVSGARVLRFALLPALRVTQVTVDGKEVAYVQEGRKEDGSFYVILPEPLQQGATRQVKVEYEGNKVLIKAGGGTFYVEARSSWYPNVNAFTEQSTYDLTFRVPKKYTLVSVGKLVKESKDGDFSVSQWVSDVPLAVAGFNYGMFKKKVKTDPESKYDIETYASNEVPDYLKNHADVTSMEARRIEETQSLDSTMTPSRMADSAMIQAQNAVRVFQMYFGALPYGRVAITQQPDFNFGQSWPSLVFLPVSAFLDSTERWQLLGQSAFKFSNFIEEVTPHEVAHQWWGHMVGWASYHDQWLSEGFADFSAGLYLQVTEPKADRFNKYWERQRQRIVDKNEYGIAASDAGPLWQGLRLSSVRTARAYSSLVYSKGGYVLHMLRQLMYDPKTRDAAFIAMMRDFVTTYTNKLASTEDFKRIAEKHMTPNLDLEGNHRLDWFFRQWVYGTEIPKYHLDYSLTDRQDGKTVLKGALTQSNVSDSFLMRVPLYADFDGHISYIGTLFAEGCNPGKEFEAVLPKRPKRVLLNAKQDVLASEVTVSAAR